MTEWTVDRLRLGVDLISFTLTYYDVAHTEVLLTMRMTFINNWQHQQVTLSMTQL